MEKQLGFETVSLIVRKFTYEDFNELNLLINQKEITNILPDWAMTEEELRGFLDFVIGSYETFNADDVRILLAIEHKQDQRLIGWCGVFPNDKLESEEREVAYAISKDYRNRGYTTEAVIGMIRNVFNISSLDEIVAIVKPFNHSSRRVLEKAGFRCIRRVTLSDDADYDYFVHER
jgi:ribosomal-protein-alanine N-acetyltransferase